MSTVRVKICGITRAADALAAVRLGADALGFNLWPDSKRYVDPDEAREIIESLPPFVSAIGVFVNQPRAEVARLAGRLRLHAIQLHGDEPPSFCAGMPVAVIKAIRVANEESLKALGHAEGVAEPAPIAS